MTPLDSEKLTELEVDLRALVLELRLSIEGGREGVKPVGLDQPIGRLSRMDAIQQQNMLQANHRAAQLRLAAAEAALRRIEQEEYGACVSCGEDVAFARLKARPESPFCVSCQGKRESG